MVQGMSMNYLFDIFTGFIILAIPLLLLLFLVDSSVKALILYFYVLTISYTLSGLSGIPMVHLYTILIFFFISLTIIKLFVLYKDLNKIRTKPSIKIHDMLVLYILYSIYSQIPINQNWDFYTFYYQAAFAQAFWNIRLLFNNVLMPPVILLYELSLSPRGAALLYMTLFYFLLRRILPFHSALALLLNPSVLSILIHENLYLELSSFVILILYINCLKDYGSNNPLTFLAVPLLFFTKGNIAFTFGSILMLYNLSVTLYALIRMGLKRFIKNYLIIIPAYAFTLVYFLLNIYKYNALNFEIIWLFSEMTNSLPKNLRDFWMVTVSGSGYSSLFKMSNLVNYANPVYMGHFAIAICIMLLLAITKPKILFKKEKYILSIKISIDKQRTKSKDFYKILMLFLFVYFMFTITILILTDTFTNIFTIRYYIPFFFLVFLLLFSLIRLIPNDYINDCIVVFNFLILLTYIYIFRHLGFFMKERILLYFLHNDFISYLITISVIIYAIIKYLLRRFRIISLGYLTRILSALVLILLTLLASFSTFSAFRLIFTGVSPDSTMYPCKLREVYPQYLDVYFESYCDNDMLLFQAQGRCKFLYIIGGISSMPPRNITLMIRGGHLSYLPFILGDLILSNYSAYQKLVSKYHFLTKFTFPRSFCLQVPNFNHSEKTFLAGIATLAEQSPFARLVFNPDNNTVLVRGQHYTIYMVNLTKFSFKD
ncbi:MAG: hypothetical protein QXL96_09030 [Ignisphaera sp.]